MTQSVPMYTDQYLHNLFQAINFISPSLKLWSQRTSVWELIVNCCFFGKVSISASWTSASPSSWISWRAWSSDSWPGSRRRRLVSWRSTYVITAVNSTCSLRVGLVQMSRKTYDDFCQRPQGCGGIPLQMFWEAPTSPMRSNGSYE
jgi:hypothetical protein